MQEDSGGDVKKASRADESDQGGSGTDGFCEFGSEERWVWDQAGVCCRENLILYFTDRNVSIRESIVRSVSK